MAFPMIVEESWEQYIGGMRSAAAAPSVNDPAYPRFESNQRLIFDSGAVDGVFTIEYRTEVVVGKVNHTTGSPCPKR